jgi:hypothetical protein
MRTPELQTGKAWKSQIQRGLDAWRRLYSSALSDCFDPFMSSQQWNLNLGKDHGL